MMAAALLSRCLYRSLRTSRSFFMVFLLGCRSIAWKFTGRPYLQENDIANILSTSRSVCGFIKTKRLKEYLKTDSTKTLSALMWIHAMKASLKFTFSHRTRGPYRDRKKRQELLQLCGLKVHSPPKLAFGFLFLKSFPKSPASLSVSTFLCNSTDRVSLLLVTQQTRFISFQAVTGCFWVKAFNTEDNRRTSTSMSLLTLDRRWIQNLRLVKAADVFYLSLLSCNNAIREFTVSPRAGRYAENLPYRKAF